MSDPSPNFTVPTPTHYTIMEGGVWFPWKPGKSIRVFALKFSNGWIWDCKVGWMVGLK